MTIAEIKELAKYAVAGKAPENFSLESVDEAFADGLRSMMSNYNEFMKNRYDIYQIIIEAADEVLPKNVLAAIGAFAEVQTVANGQKALFKKNKGKQRAKQFITQVGINGVYETFRLDKSTFELGGHAVGGGATVDFQRVVDGAESLMEVMAILTEGITDAVFVEVQKALVAAFSAAERPAANKVEVSGFDADEMVKLVNVVRAYGNGAIIYACPEFVAAMGADAIVPTLMNSTTNVAQGIYSPADIEAIHNTGYINLFRGTPVVRMPQSFIDENNNATYLNPQYAFVMPTGGEKVVKVVLEGPTFIRDYENRDGSTEVYMEKKIGAAILYHNNWGIYKNSSLTDTSASVYPRL